MDSVYDPDHGNLPSQFKDTRAARILRRRAATEYVGERIPDLAFIVVGLTERDVEVSQSQTLAKIARSIVDEGVPYSALIFGGMNRGKTGFAGLWLELWRELVPLKFGTEESVVVTNVRTLPVWWPFAECSSHLDARTFSHEVSTQYLPLVKRFAKVRVDAVHLGHSGMDIYKDMRRSQITTEFVFKIALKTAEVVRRMVDGQGVDLEYELRELQQTTIAYDPGDSPLGRGNIRVIDLIARDTYPTHS